MLMIDLGFNALRAAALVASKLCRSRGSPPSAELLLLVLSSQSNIMASADQEQLLHGSKGTRWPASNKSASWGARCESHGRGGSGECFDLLGCQSPRSRAKL